MPKATRALIQGFSFFELMIVIALLAFICSLSISLGKRFQASAVCTELDRLAAVFIFMQRKALLESAACIIVFESASNSYQADHYNTLSPGVYFGILPGVLGPPANPTVKLTDAITFPYHTATFYPDGTIAAGAIYLTDKKSVLYALTTDASAVTHIRCYCYRKGWWLL